jgi:hypothetical protein
VPEPHLDPDPDVPDPDAPDVPQPGDPDASGPPVPEASPVPTEAELERVAEPAIVRRAPRYRAFVLAGVVLGLLATLVVVLVTAGEDVAGAVIANVMIGLGLVTVCGVGGAVAAVLVEAGSRRR